MYLKTRTRHKMRGGMRVFDFSPGDIFVLPRLIAFGDRDGLFAFYCRFFVGVAALPCNMLLSIDSLGGNLAMMG
jgi:hypothetical protein